VVRIQQTRRSSLRSPGIVPPPGPPTTVEPFRKDRDTPRSSFFLGVSA
jgi:hypothetical protein